MTVIPSRWSIAWRDTLLALVFERARLQVRVAKLDRDVRRLSRDCEQLKTSISIKDREIQRLKVQAAAEETQRVASELLQEACERELNAKAADEPRMAYVR